MARTTPEVVTTTITDTLGSRSVCMCIQEKKYDTKHFCWEEFTIIICCDHKVLPCTTTVLKFSTCIRENKCTTRTEYIQLQSSEL